MSCSLRPADTVTTGDQPSQARNPPIADALQELLYACRSILKAIGHLEDTDHNVETMSNEMRELTVAIEGFTDQFTTPGEAEHDQKYWELLKGWVVDCKHALERVESILDGAGKVENRTPPIEVKSDLKFPKEQIMAYRLAIQLSLQLLHENLSKKPENVINAISCLLRLFPQSSQPQALEINSTGNISHATHDYNEWANFAQRLVNPDTNEIPKEVEQYVHEHMQSLRIDEGTNKDAATLENPPETNNSQNNNVSDDSVHHLSVPDDSVNNLDVPRSRPTLRNPAHVKSIDNLRKLARRSFDARDFTSVEPMLERIMEKSEDAYGPGFTWRDETMEMWATAYWELGKWEAADKLFDQHFRGRAKLMETLARESLKKGRRNSAERLLTKHFEGREPIMEMFVQLCLREKKWNEAKRYLVELLQYDTDQTDRLKRMYTLATVCFSLKEYGEAEAWCLKVVLGSQAMLGENNNQCYDSIRLLARIYNIEGDDAQTDAYQAVLADLSPGLHECVEIEQLSYLLEDKNHCKEAMEQIGKRFFCDLISESTDRQSIRENIQKSGYRVVGSGRGWALIHELAAHGLGFAVQLLLEKGADIEAMCYSGTPLVVAAERGHSQTVKLLLDKGAKVKAKDKEGRTALNVAVLNGHEQCVQLLLEKGADTETKVNGQTPLIVAAMHGYEGIVKFLLDKNANIEAASKMGTALIEATWGGSTGTVKLLLERGAKTDASTQKHGTALNIAAMSGYEDIVRLLLDNGANIESRNKEGKTPLLLAAKSEEAEVVKLLLSRGADIKAKDSYGSTALGLANSAPASKGTTLVQMTNLHMTETVTTLITELQRRQKERQIQ